MGKTPSLRLALLAILFAPLLALVAEAAALTELTQGQVFRLQNKAFARYYLTGTSTNTPQGATGVTTPDASFLLQCWKVVTTTNTDGLVSFQLQNLGNEKYLTNTFTHTAYSETGTFTLYLSSQGEYNTICKNSTLDGNNYLHIGTNTGNAASWAASAGGSQWTFEPVSTSLISFIKAKENARTLYPNTLQTSNADGTGYLFCNDPFIGNDQSGDYSPASKGYNLLDNNKSTYLHTTYSENNKKKLSDQWLRVSYPSGVDQFSFSYITRGTANVRNDIKTMVVEGSVDDVTYTTIKKYTEDDALPTGVNQTFTSGTLGTEGTLYKHIRFRVLSTYSNKQYYTLAEFGFERPSTSVAVTAENTIKASLISAIESTSSITLSSTDEEINSALSTLTSAISDASTDLAYAKAKLLYAKNTLEKEYIGENGFVTSYDASTQKYVWLSKYEADKESLRDLVNNMRSEITAATAAYNGTNVDAYNTHINQCEALTLKAQEVKFYNYSLPVKMSTPEATYYYSIHEKGTDLVWQYNTSTKDESWTNDDCANKVKLLTISAAAEQMENGVEIGNPRHAFYFKRGAKIPEVYIYNAYDGYRLCATRTDFAEGAGKAKFLKESTESEANSDFDNASCRSWEIIKNGDCYNLRGIATDENNPSRLYAAHVASPENTNNLGFSTDASADIAKFTFEFNKYPNKTCAYYRYRDYFLHQLRWDMSKKDKLGYPTSSTYLKDSEGNNESHSVTYNYIENYWAAYNRLYGSIVESDNDVNTGLDKLKKYNEALTMYVPTAPTYYTFNSGLSALTAYSLAIDPATRQLSAKAGMVQTVNDKTTEHTQALWLLTPAAGKNNTFTMQNVHTGLYVQSFAGGTLSMDKNAAEIVLASRDLTKGQFAFTATDASTYVLTAAEADGAVSAAEQADKPAADAADCWTATAVTDLTTVQHPVSITSYGKAGFYSSHEVKLPKEVQAWYMAGTTQVDGDGVTRITMTQVAPETDGTTILPKETAVLLVTPTAPAATTPYDLTYSTTTKAAVEGNKLSGVAYSQAVEGGKGTTCYKFGVVDGLAALYPMYQEYNKDGELTNAKTDEGGYIKASANKIFLKIEGQQKASRLEFRFTDPTTGIEQIITDANATTPADTCYDLQGRRIQGRPAGGIYIVNGVKRIIRR